ncbi:shikimate/quinate 5-dehydrogenase [Microthyrium microscopicum]|uniref:Shikimate/quinate 5-dehydrogenase n=1 Tax=Microthyrium microscopicum TaxID=703497 RepID=A0A6A6UKI7_9PEZI|nr:shikimate/quinate 5-dehydrogenase [Microthyrium microscopicum]
MPHSVEAEGVGCLFGFPIAHSLSPLFHQTSYDDLGIPWKFTFLESKSIHEFLEFIRNPKCYVGSAVTMPHKVAIMDHLDGLTDEGREVGAVNTIIIREEQGRRKYIGTNTDVFGIRESFYQNVSDRSLLDGKPGLVIGSGGAARSAVYALRRMMNCKPVYIVNRFKDEVDQVIQECQSIGFGQNLIHVETVEQAQELAAPGAIVSCIPDFPPTTPEEIRARSVIEAMLNKEQKGAILEMCYHPSPWTELGAIAEKSGWQVILGTEAMIYQGIEQQKLWTGKSLAELPVEKVKAVIHEQLKQSRH